MGEMRIDRLLYEWYTEPEMTGAVMQTWINRITSTLARQFTNRAVFPVQGIRETGCPILEAAIGWTLYTISNRGTEAMITAVSSPFSSRQYKRVPGFESFTETVERNCRRVIVTALFFRHTICASTSLSRSGTTAWYSCSLDDLVELDGGESVGEKVRWTGVLNLRSRKWMHTLLHFPFRRNEKKRVHTEG